jgi:hypothetical protein
MSTNSSTTRVPIDRASAHVWVEVAQASRVFNDLLDQTPRRTDASRFAQMEQTSPDEPVERWCRSYLSAALEHLVMWADYVAPLKLHPEAEQHFTARPAQTLARAALESASQAVWVFAARSPHEMALRHITLVLEDWEQQRKAAIELAEKTALKAKRDTLLTGLGLSEADLRAPSYLMLVTAAAAEVRSKGSSSDVPDEAHVQRLWRASAGSAHGKRWTSIELRKTVTIGGQNYSVADPEAMSAMLGLAAAVTTYGVARFNDFAGHASTLTPRLRTIHSDWYERVPKISGAPNTLPTHPQ